MIVMLEKMVMIVEMESRELKTILLKILALLFVSLKRNTESSPLRLL